MITFGQAYKPTTVVIIEEPTSLPEKPRFPHKQFTPGVLDILEGDKCTDNYE